MPTLPLHSESPLPCCPCTAVILSHDYPVTDPQGSTVAQVVPVMIDWARRNGLTMATVHECMGYPDPASWYVTVGSPGTRDASWVC